MGSKNTPILLNKLVTRTSLRVVPCCLKGIGRNISPLVGRAFRCGQFAYMTCYCCRFIVTSKLKVMRSTYKVMSSPITNEIAENFKVYVVY